jgi:hypothetical protein
MDDGVVVGRRAQRIGSRAVPGINYRLIGKTEPGL